MLTRGGAAPVSALALARLRRTPVPEGALHSARRSADTTRKSMQVMSEYSKFFGLERAPFEGRFADALLLETGPLRRAVTGIRDEIQEGTAIVALTGSRGVGKTCVAMALPHVLGGRVARLLDASLDWEEIQRSITEQLGLPEGELGRSALLDRRFSEPGRLVVVVDNAEQLRPEPCAALRSVIANANEPGGTLLHCALFANPERSAARTPAAGWVKSTQSRIELAPMLARELQRYIEARLESAGWGGGDLFSEGALDVIHQLSGGFPRAANGICEQALVQAAQTGQRRIDANLIEALGVRTRTPASPDAEATEPSLRTSQGRRSPRAKDDPLPADRAATAEEGSGRPLAHAPETNLDPHRDGDLPVEHPAPLAHATEPALRGDPRGRPDTRPTAPAPRRGPTAAPRSAASPAPHPGSAATSVSPAQLRPSQSAPPGAPEAEPQRRTRPWLSAALPALASRFAWNWKLRATLVSGAAVVLLAGQVVRLSSVEGCPSIEPRASDAEPAPRDSWQRSTALTPLSDRTVDPWSAPWVLTDSWHQGSFEPLATSQEIHPAEDSSSDETELPLDAPTEAAEATAAAETPPEPPTPTAASGSSGWLDDLDVSLDAQPTGPAARTPTLALPEPGLARRLSTAGASTTEHRQQPLKPSR